MSKENINFIPKGWGFEKWIANSKEYCGKLLYIAKGKKTSWHFHILKDETFYVQSGRIQVFYFNDEDLSQAEVIILEPGDAFHVPRRLKHRIFAILDSEIFEFSTEHFDSDSHRIQVGD